MAIEEGNIDVGETGKKLDTAVVAQTDTTEVHREVVTLGDPEFLSRIANVVQQGSVNALIVSQIPILTDAFSGFGEKEDANGSNLDIWGGPTDIQPEPDVAGYALFVISSSTDDDIAGIGARTVEVHYLDTAGAEQAVTVDMDGTTEVDSLVTDCMFVQDLHVMTLGTEAVAVGNIDALAGTGGAVIGRINATGNQSMSTARQIPVGKNLIVTGWHAMGTAATTKIATIRLRSSDQDGIINPGVYHFKDAARVKDSTTGHMPTTFLVPPLSVIKISAWTTGSIGVTAKWMGFLQDIA